MKILFITTHNLATNPRLVKEITLALQHNYQVEVICYIFRNWSYEMNKALMRDLESQNVVFHNLEAGKKNLLPWFISVGKEKLNRRLGKVSSLKNSSLANAVSRRSHGLVNAISKVKSADWVIGHNPGALWATVKAGERFQCKTGFDVEDYHPGEGHDKYSQNLTRQLMQEVLPKMDYVSFASPLIREAVKKDLDKEGKNWMTVLNYFPGGEFTSPISLHGPLKMIWFSQNIAPGRGLEFVLPAIKKLSNKVELHLIGHADNSFYESTLKDIPNIILHEPLHQADLHKKLSEFDIGLALEFASDKNRELCLTNKILAYLQAGLYIMATGTPAQGAFLRDYPSHGETFKISQKAAEQALTELFDRIEKIRFDKETRYQTCRLVNWENQSNVLMQTWKI